MTEPLLDAVRRYVAAHADRAGVAQTPVPGLTTIRSTAPSGLVHAISQPLVCLVLQGSKQVAMGTESFQFNAGDSLLITADVPTVSQITRASADVPYLSLVLDLDPALIAELALQMGTASATEGGALRMEPTDQEVADAALRLMRLLDRPEALPVLHAQRVRELHYWLLAGRHGPAIRRLGWPDGHAQRIARGSGTARGIYAAAAGGAAGGGGGDEPVVVPPAFSCGDFAIAAAVPEAVAANRGTPADDGGRRDGKQRRLCGGLRERVAVHAGVWPDVRPAARPGY